MRRKRAPLLSFTMALVRLAEAFLIVVLSSTAIKILPEYKNRCANSAPFLVENASTFITRTRRPGMFEQTIFSSAAFSFAFGLGFHGVAVY